jgi:hypothetical protein
MTKVDITTAGHTIIIECDGDLGTVAAKALELWRETRDPKIDKSYGTTGFSTERSDGPFWSGHDGDLAAGNTTP